MSHLQSDLVACTIPTALSSRCQPMVVGGNSRNERTPVWGTVKETFHCKQLNCDTMVLRQSLGKVAPPARQLCSTPRAPIHSILLPAQVCSSKTSPVFPLQLGKQPSVFPPRGALGPSSCKHSNKSSPLGPKYTVLIGENGANLVSEDANWDIAVQLWLDRESLSLSPLG